MSFRIRLLAAFFMTVALAVGVVGWTVSVTTRRAFERMDNQRITALVGQFRREFQARGREVARRIEGIANTPSMLQIAIDLGRRNPDYSLYVNEAQGLAAAQGLDFLELVANDGTIVSSAQWPARFGYKEDWVTQGGDWKHAHAFLKREALPDGTALALESVAVVSAGDKKLYVIGGERLDREFLASLVLPQGMRALLYRNLEPGFSPDSLVSASGEVSEAQKLQPLIARVQHGRRETSQTITWSSNAASAETFHAIPLTGRGDRLLGVLLVGSSRRDLVQLLGFIRRVGFLAGGAGILLGIFLSYWVTARISSPVRRLAKGARDVAAGDWETRVDIPGSDEISELARTFNQMTGQLIEQRDRLIQAERVAAWRELARRLAHELKNPLFPLQITVENLQRAREQHPEQFEEVFRESTGTLLAELATLRQIIGRFSDFAKMPPPQLQEVQVNDLLRTTMKLFDAQFQAPDRPPIVAQLEIDENLPAIPVDPDQISRALHNLVLNAIDAMPSGGTLSIRTMRHDSGVRLEVSDTGEGLTKEECERLFTPYYTTRKHGTGLGLAIVQSVVSDHHGRISVESEPGRGTTFRIDLKTANENG